MTDTTQFAERLLGEDEVPISSTDGIDNFCLRKP